MALGIETALVTGATSGIGAATARALAGGGVRVLATGRDEERGAALAAGIGERCAFVAADLKRAAAADELVALARERLGGLDLLVNAAGIIHSADAVATDDAIWRETMEVNLDAAFRLSRAALRVMRERGRGAIVNVASDWGLVGGREAVAYCASKGAMVQMTRAMALDHAREGIRVNAVCPGEVDTPMLEREAEWSGLGREAAYAAWADAAPDGRIATAAEVAAAIVFLASDAASHITGVALAIDGGGLAR